MYRGTQISYLPGGDSISETPRRWLEARA